MSSSSEVDTVTSGLGQINLEKEFQELEPLPATPVKDKTKHPDRVENAQGINVVG